MLFALAAGSSAAAGPAAGETLTIFTGPITQ
jgi:hypothetical protein